MYWTVGYALNECYQEKEGILNQETSILIATEFANILQRSIYSFVTGLCETF